MRRKNWEKNDGLAKCNASAICCIDRLEPVRYIFAVEWSSPLIDFAVEVARGDAELTSIEVYGMLFMVMVEDKLKEVGIVYLLPRELRWVIYHLFFVV